MTSVALHKSIFAASEREDCIDKSLDDDCWLLNPKWKVQPSIVFVEGQGPCVLTCKHYDGRAKLHMIHTYYWKTTLPSKRPDQLCQALVNPRVINPVK